jgi:serine/threonine-protein kinase
MRSSTRKPERVEPASGKFRVRRAAGGPSFGKYRSLRIIGEGANAVVHLAEHVEIGKLVAVKWLRAEYANDDAIARLRREARTLVVLSHPALVDVDDFGVRERRPWFAMDYVEAPTLRDILDGDELPSSDETLRLVIGLLEGLRVVHAAGLVHSDIKPENILVTQRLRLVDFGAAWALGSDSSVAGMLGTPHYMAPEQIRGDEVDHRADLFAVGAVLAEMLTGHSIGRGSMSQMVGDRATRPAPTLHELSGRAFSPELETVVARALALDPAARFAAADEMIAALASLGAARSKAVA